MFHIIDDTSIICELLTDILNTQGYETHCFSSPESYVKYIASAAFEEPSGVFTDINMPMMSGYEMIDIVSIIRPNLKFAIITSESKIRPGYIESGEFYLEKPFRIDAVVAIADAFLKHESQMCPQSDGKHNPTFSPHCA
jgi:DNA-binding NtrC family response regulator